MHVLRITGKQRSSYIEKVLVIREKEVGSLFYFCFGYKIRGKERW